MEKLKQMKECLTGIVEGQVYGNLQSVSAEELGEAVDMIKDLAEAIYYCTITEAMEKEDKEGKSEKHGMMYSSTRMMPMYRYPYDYPIEYYDPRYRERSMPMYASDSNGRSGGSSNSNSGNGNSSSNSGGNNARGGGSRGYSEGNMMYNDGGYMYHHPMERYPMDWDMPMHERDPREGKSGERRKMYMEGKGMKDKSHQMKELEEYMQELTQDLSEMIQDASPEEKQLLQQKISILATKIK